MKKIKAAMAAMAIVALTFTACSGDDGAAGPAGATGNANVQSTTHTILSADWGTNGTTTIPVPTLTKAIADNGVVTAFFTTDSLGTDTIGWNPLPFSFPISGTAFATVSIGYRIGEVDVNLLANNLSGNGLSFTGDSHVRIVLIPSSSLVDGIDVNNYEEVKMVYGIEEYDVK